MVRDNRALTASMMVGVGILFLIDRFAFLSGIGNNLWALLFLGGGAIFVALYSRQPRLWWALFPGFALIAMAAAVVAGSVGGMVLMALGGAVLVALYLTNRTRWWALVGGGSLLSLTLMALFERAFPRLDNGWLLFGGLAVTFLFVYYGSKVRANWSLFAAMAFGAFALLSLFTGRLAEAFIGLALMGTGGYILWREADRAAGDLPASENPAQSGAATPSDGVALPAVPGEAATEKPDGIFRRFRQGR